MTEIIYAQDMKEALEATKRGFEPVECSFGRDSVVGIYKLDHHGQYSSEEAVSIKAARLALEDVKLEKFVVTGAADCDQCYAIAALSGPKIPINLNEATAVADIDIDPIGRDLTSDKYIRILIFNQKTQSLPNGLDSTLKSLYELIEIFNGRYSEEDVKAAIEKENKRKQIVRSGIKEIEPGKIALVNSDARGFDVWYEYAPVVVAYVEPKKAITLGLCPKTGGTLGDKSGLDLLGQEGLNKVFPKLDELIKPGWGGRETIGGSPRNIPMTYEDAVKVYQLIKEIIK